MNLYRVIEILKQFRDREGNSSEDIEAFTIAINLVYTMLVINDLYVVRSDKNEI